MDPEKLPTYRARYRRAHCRAGKLTAIYHIVSGSKRPIQFLERAKQTTLVSNRPERVFFELLVACGKAVSTIGATGRRIPDEIEHKLNCTKPDALPAGVGRC